MQSDNFSDYDFSQLLRVSFALRPDNLTQAEIAEQAGISATSLNNWLTGVSKPKNKQSVLNLLHLFALSQLQVDLHLYKINPGWSQYGTPTDVLANISLLSYQEYGQRQTSKFKITPSPRIIEDSWKLSLHETFESNYNGWGLGVREDNIMTLHKELANKKLILWAKNNFDDSAEGSADSCIVAPKNYYFAFEVEKLAGGTNDNPLILFEHINERCHAIVRLRAESQELSVAKTRIGQRVYDIILRKIACPFAKPIKNKIALLTMEKDFYCYVNDVYVAHFEMERLPVSRLDVGLMHGSGTHICKFAFSNLKIFVPNDLSGLKGTLTQW